MRMTALTADHELSSRGPLVFGVIFPGRGPRVFGGREDQNRHRAVIGSRLQWYDVYIKTQERT